MTEIPVQSCQADSSSIYVLPCSDLPFIQGLDEGGGVGTLHELRDDPVLAHFIPESGYLSTNIIKLKQGEQLPVHYLPSKCVLIIMQGTGEIIGDQTSQLKKDSLVCINQGSYYGVVAGESGISFICMRFGKRHLQEILKERDKKLNNTNLTYQEVLKLNNDRLEECKQSAYFTMLVDGTLNDLKKRKVYLSCVKKVADYFQVMLYTRQATCADKKFFSIFLEHLNDEAGHNESFFDEGNIENIKDPEFEAILTWFCYKMITLDNIGKAIVHLVFELVGDYMCNFVQDKEIYNVAPEYFHVHSEADEGHAAMVIDLLQDQHPEVYQRVINTTNESWDMFMVMFDRMVRIVNQV